ncbi:hypothetical protein [Bacillus sp. es.036]|uniref:hypothetical protein n=1 Tax=Bacillus sp. es.036 TaxID=1761764 RepID=UPI000BF5138E|nr:hypothetical protein [Bacillus sp. es.036]PFG03029.1 hypothetical protein ATG70_4258 [Bacillus sp. es.036]
MEALDKLDTLFEEIAGKHETKKNPKVRKERIANDEKLNQKILVDLKKGELKWKEVAELHEVEMNYVRSVYAYYRSEIDTYREGRTYKGSRVSDNIISPIRKFNVNDLSEHEAESMGLLYLKR